MWFPKSTHAQVDYVGPGGRAAIQAGRHPVRQFWVQGSRLSRTELWLERLWAGRAGGQLGAVPSTCCVAEGACVLFDIASNLDTTP